MRTLSGLTSNPVAAEQWPRRGCNRSCTVVDVLVSSSDVQEDFSAMLGSEVGTCSASSGGFWTYSPTFSS